MNMQPTEDDYINECKIVDVSNIQDLTIANTNVKPEIKKYLEKEYILQAIDKAPIGMSKMLLTFLWCSGCRITEALLLQKKDINFQTGMILIKWLKHRAYIYRTIPIPKPLLSLLLFYTANFKAEDKVFPISRQRAFQITKQYAGISPHCFRHSFAVHYLKSGGRIENLNRLLGHMNIRTTMEYLKIVPTDLKKELDTIDFN